MFLNRDAIWVGVVVGLLVPFVGYAVLLMIYEALENLGWASSAGFLGNFRERTIALVAVSLNIIPMNMFMARRNGNSMRGVLVVTMVYAIIWFLYFRDTIL